MIVCNAVIQIVEKNFLKHTMNIKETYKLACLCTTCVDPKDKFIELLKSIETDTKKHLSLTINKVIKCKCHHCKQVFTELPEIYYSYWGAVWIPLHKECIQPYKEVEILFCQKVDADCNDCIYFDRTNTKGESLGMSREFFSKIKTIKGYCSFHDKVTEASPNNFSGYPCFKHRKEV